MAEEPTSFAIPSGYTPMGAWGGTVQYGVQDSGKAVMFYNRSVRDAVLSRQEGRPYFTDKVFVKIQTPGERLEVIDREVNESDKARWPVQWARFQANQQQVPDGTPIDLLYPDSPSVASMLRAEGIHTIEQCSMMSAHAIGNIMGGQQYANKARTYLEQANRGVGMHQFEQELAERDAKIRMLEESLRQQQATINALMTAQQAAGFANFQEFVAKTNGRPTFPGAAAQPPLTSAFDPAAAQIAANHPTADAARRPRRARAGVSTPEKE